ncbi:hypothetical protein HDV01_005573 [Terramyces sp. JEL0728]|nr:hypothetical protein HDV01_005573 [Terramyces sp. JEL0728]
MRMKEQLQLCQMQELQLADANTNYVIGLMNGQMKDDLNQQFQPQEKRRETSWVRQHLQKIIIDGQEKVTCVHCGKVFFTNKANFKVSNTSAAARHLHKEHADKIESSSRQQPYEKVKKGMKPQVAKTMYAETFQKATQAIARLELLVQKTFGLDTIDANPLVQDFLRSLSLLYPNQWHYQLPPMYIQVWHLALQDFEYYPFTCWHAISTFKDPNHKEVFGINHDPLALGIGSEEEREINFRIEFKNYFNTDLFELQPQQ